MKIPDKDNNIFKSLSAADKQIGFDYQTNYFLLKLLESTEGQIIEYEVKDDINIIHNNGTVEYIQVKHTVNVGTENLTELDSDFWKTLSNWSKIILTGIDLNKSKFTILTNKKLGSRNKLIVNIIKYQNNEINDDSIIKYIKSLKEKTKDANIKAYIEIFLKLGSFNLKKVLKQINFVTSEDDIIKKIKMKIKMTKVREERVDIIFDMIFSNLKLKMNSLIEKKEKISYTSEKFNEEFTLCFDKGRLQRPIRRKFNFLEDEVQKALLEPEKLIFLTQLHDINDIEINSDDEDIYRYISEMLNLLYTLKDLEQNNELLNSEIEIFYDLSEKEWKNKFKRMKKELKKTPKTQNQEEQIIDCANNLLDDVRDIRLKLDNDELEIDLSNGMFYLLSNKPDIGWRIDWKEKYENN